MGSSSCEHVRKSFTSCTTSVIDDIIVLRVCEFIPRTETTRIVIITMALVLA
jgi:hypothetical protein